MNNFLIGSTSCFSNYVASYKIISLAPKSVLKTVIFGEKAILPLKGLLRPFFFVLSSTTTQKSNI